ncbi:MAG TPA: hypothetical protein VKP68_14255 [Ramlibacter sp.]|nr:hypothetical protein [Ramlibacter sp.]
MVLALVSVPRVQEQVQVLARVSALQVQVQVLALPGHPPAQHRRARHLPAWGLRPAAALRAQRGWAVV